MAQPSTIGDRLLAHARLCREIASATSSEVTAAALEHLALDCIAAATSADSTVPRHGVPGSTVRSRATV